MGREAIKVCAFCNGSGMIRKTMEYPDLMNQQWCQNCDASKAKSERVVALVRQALSETRRAAAA